MLKNQTALDAEAIKILLPFGVSNIKHWPERRYCQAPEPSNAGSERVYVGPEPKLLQDRQTGLLQHQTGSDRFRLGKLIKNPNAVTIPRKKSRKREPANARTNDRNFSRPAHFFTLQRAAAIVTEAKTSYLNAMTQSLKMLVAQLNPVVGDVKGNKALAETAHAEGKAKGADLIVFSELFILGYPAEDLVLKPAAVEHSMAAIEDLKALTKNGPGMLIGAPWRDGDKLHNSVLLLQDGEIRLRYDTRELPNSGVFDEKRIFDAG